MENDNERGIFSFARQKTLPHPRRTQLEPNPPQEPAEAARAWGGFATPRQAN
jgi:hypothetical protein